MRISQLLVALTSFTITQSLPFPNDDAVGVVWQFPYETWIENLAVRQNGEILCMSLSAAAIYLVNPFDHTETTVHQFEAGNGVMGIAEIQNDVFIALTSQVNLATSTAVAGSAAA